MSFGCPWGSHRSHSEWLLLLFSRGHTTGWLDYQELLYISKRPLFLSPSVSLSYLVGPPQRFDCRWRKWSQMWQWKSPTLSDWDVAFLHSLPETLVSQCPGMWSAPKTRMMRTSRVKKKGNGSACSPLAMMPFSEMETAAPERRRGQIPACSLRGWPLTSIVWPFKVRDHQTQDDTTATLRSGFSTPAMHGTAWPPTTLGSLLSMWCNKVSP